MVIRMSGEKDFTMGVGVADWYGPYSAADATDPVGLGPASIAWGEAPPAYDSSQMPALRAAATTAPAVVPPATISGARPIEL